ncbi:MAG: hypothetical protein M0T75_10700 [Chloroflexi bacterium]|nr:hypothetical protein [Chloroflexota bacterium]
MTDCVRAQKQGLGLHPRWPITRGRLVATAALALALAACAPSPPATGTGGPVAATTPPAENSPVAPGTLLTCGGTRTFAAAALANPTGIERSAGPAFDALREALRAFGSQFEGSAGWTWRLVAEDSAGALFLARRHAAGAVPWVQVEVQWSGGRMRPVSMGDCALRSVLGRDLAPGTWILDPDSGAPSPEASELRVLVWDGSCDQGPRVLGRLLPPVIEYRSDAVVVTLAARRVDGVLACHQPAGTPMTISLEEAIGGRRLLDGSRFPPAPPSQP